MSVVDMGVAEGWFEVTGRGWCASFPGGSHEDPRSLLGGAVRIDDADYVVTGVDHFAIVCPSSWRPACTHSFGLLVRPAGKAGA